MKKSIYNKVYLVIFALAMTACADLGFGVDVDSQGANPYWYGNGYLGSNYWNTPVWNYGPVYNPRPTRPPYIVVTPPPAPTPQPAVRPQAPRPQRPSENRPVVNVRPTVNGGAMQSNPSTIPQGHALE